MFSAYLAPTEYDQPKPIDGEYPATVFETYAEFQYLGRKVLARISAQGSMNADGNPGRVIVKGDDVEITWNGGAPYKPFEYARSDEREIRYDLSLIASLVPEEFDQPHPLTDNPYGFKCRTRSIDIEFGVLEKYRARLDGYIQFPVMDAPCVVKPLEGEPLKCLVVFDEETIFLAKRYGRGVHDRLVAKAVNELQALLP
ncbi:hypothetical protein ACM7DS_01375 [Pseudomonas aeruginosa]